MLKIVFLLLLFPLPTYCQPNLFQNYTELSKYECDFNGDGQLDKIVIYEKKCNNSDEDAIKSTCRRVAIFLKSNNNYLLYGYNDKVIECSACGGAGTGDPFRGIKTKNKYFSIESLYGACDKTFSVITFKFDKKSGKFFLYKIGTTDYSCKGEENSTGEIKITTTTKTEKDFGKINFINY